MSYFGFSDPTGLSDAVGSMSSFVPDPMESIRSSVDMVGESASSASSFIPSVDISSNIPNMDMNMDIGSGIKMDGFIPDMGFTGTSKETPKYQDMDLNKLSTEEAAEVIWSRMLEYMEENGKSKTKELFQEFDVDKSGKIDAKEFKQALDKMGMKGVSFRVVQAIMKHADPGGDKELDYKELLEIIKKHKKITAAEAAVKSKLEEEEAARIKAEEEATAATKKAEEEEAARIKTEEEATVATKKAEEEETARIKAEEEATAATKKAEEEETARIKAEEEATVATKKAEEEEAARIKAEEEATVATKKAEEEEAARIKIEEETTVATKRAEEEEATRIKAEEEATAATQKADDTTTTKGTIETQEEKSDEATSTVIPPDYALKEALKSQLGAQKQDVWGEEGKPVDSMAELFKNKPNSPPTTAAATGDETETRSVDGSSNEKLGTKIEGAEVTQEEKANNVKENDEDKKEGISSNDQPEDDSSEMPKTVQSFIVIQATERFRTLTAKFLHKTVTVTQFKALVSKVLGKVEASSSDLASAFKVADQDKDGEINEVEFLSLVQLIEKGSVTGIGGNALKLIGLKSQNAKDQKLDFITRFQHQHAESMKIMEEEERIRAEKEEQLKKEVQAGAKEEHHVLFRKNSIKDELKSMKESQAAEAGEDTEEWSDDDAQVEVDKEPPVRKVPERTRSINL